MILVFYGDRAAARSSLTITTLIAPASAIKITRIIKARDLFIEIVRPVNDIQTLIPNLTFEELNIYRGLNL